MLHDIKRCIQVFAARPVDPKTFVEQIHDPTIREMYGHGPMKNIMNAPMFNSDEYHSFQQRVRATEDASIGLLMDEQTQFSSNEMQAMFGLLHQTTQELSMLKEDVRKLSCSSGEQHSLPLGIARNATDPVISPILIPVEPPLVIPPRIVKRSME
jgi:hypothetical protein